MEYLTLKTRGKFQNAKIAISGLTQTKRYRCVREAIGGQHQVERNDNEKWLDFMDDSHILDGTSHNGKKLHLNSKESAYLVTIFIKFLRPSGNKAKHTKKGFQNPLHH